MASQLVLGVPAQIVDLVQSGLLERAFHDALYPKLAYRAEAMLEEWPANTGTEIVMTRAGLLAPTVKPLLPGQDPTPKTPLFEQWVAVLAQYGDGLDTHMPTSTVANANLFMRDIQQLGLQAGQSVNRVARNTFFKAYLAGNGVATTAIAAADTSLRMAALNGFTDVVIPGLTARPQPISPAFPLPITIGVGASAVKRNAIGYVPDDATDPYGPGTLILSAAVGSIFAGPRTPVVSAYATKVVRSAAGASIDAIGSADLLTLQQVINSVGNLRRANVQPHEDGFYHAHISASANSQIFADPVFQRLNTALPDHVIYREGFIGHMSGVLFYWNNESPEVTNVGALIATGTGGAGEMGQYGSEIGAEMVNGAGVAIGRVLITGKGALYEKYLDESAFVTEAGTTGKIGEFDVVNNSMSVMTEKIRLVIRAPLDRLQQVVSSTWSISTSFAVPSDILAPSGPERFKRAIVLEYAM